MSTTLKVKKGDTVLVMHGKDRGKRGKVVSVFPKVGRILVEGVNQKTRHTRPRRMGEKGQRITVTHPIYAASVRVVCPSCGKGTRVGFEMHDKTKVRICKKCGVGLA